MKFNFQLCLAVVSKLYGSMTVWKNIQRENTLFNATFIVIVTII